MDTPTDVQTPGGALSYLTAIGYTNSSSCGYCGAGRRGNRSNSRRFSYYASATSLSPEFYQDLIDHYWRRSGTLLYRPNPRQSCCPHYTIRLDSTLFKPTRDQRQTVNRFNSHVTGPEYAAKVARVHPQSHAEKKKRQNEFDLVERVHEAEYERLHTPPEPALKFTVTLEEDNFTEEKFQVYENYQRIVHKDESSETTRQGFRRFLCSSPIRRRTEKRPDGTAKLLGSYHQCYRLDGKLVAIGVLDLLPHCVSAVYFLYHESIHKFAPGKLGAIREIALAREGGYRFWYPGFYIHSCPKMRYKIDYLPQYILDPETLDWDLLDRDVLSLLDKQAYLSLSGERKKAITAPNTSESIGENPAADKDVNAVDPQVEVDDEDSAPLFKSNMPGIPTLEDMALVDLDNISICVDGSGSNFKTSDLVIWQKEEMTTAGGLKNAIAELVAAVGPELVDGICLDFGR